MDGSDSDAGMKENNNSINRLKNRRNVNSKSILSPLVLENRDSITEILPYLLIASIGDSILDDAKLLSDSGIKYLISCAKENRMLSKRRKALSAMNLSLTEIQLDDAPDAALTEPIKIVFPIIKRAKKENKKCLIYCQRGMSRSVSLVLAYLNACEKMTLHEALSHVRSVRRFASPNLGFMAQLISLEISLDKLKGGEGRRTIDFNKYVKDRFEHTDELAPKSQGSAEEVSKVSSDLQARTIRLRTGRKISASSILEYIESPLMQPQTISHTSEEIRDNSLFLPSYEENTESLFSCLGALFPIEETIRILHDKNIV